MSVTIEECYQNIIGITLDPCECVDDSLIPADYNVSKSGIYFDQLDGIDLVTLNNLGLCNEIWTSIQLWIARAITTMKSDAMKEIMKKNQQLHYNYSGQIGSLRKDNYNSITANYAGVKMFCAPIRDGYMKINRIGIILNDTQNVQLSIYDSISDTALDTVTLTSVAGQVSWTTVNKTYPLWNDEINNIEYSFLYDPTGLQIANNKAIKDCSANTWCFDRSNPCFARVTETKDRWRHWVMAGGVQGDNINDREDWGGFISTNGLVFDVQFYCNSFNTLCNDKFTDFAADPVDEAQAKAVWYKSGEFAMRATLASKELNIQTMTNQEAMVNYIQYYLQEYQKQITFIGQNIDVARSGCLACRDSYGYKKRTIYL